MEEVKGSCGSGSLWPVHMSKYPEFLFYAGVSIVGSVYRGVLADFSKDGSWRVSWGVQPTWPILPMIVLQPSVRSIARRPHASPTTFPPKGACEM